LEKRDIEKMNKDTVLERRNKRYTDKLQSINIKTNELIFIISVTVFKDSRSERRQKSILPPSNSYIGKRFNRPKKSDALIKRVQKLS
jgi:hypothetical protein